MRQKPHGRLQNFFNQHFPLGSNRRKIVRGTGVAAAFSAAVIGIGSAIHLGTKNRANQPQRPPIVQPAQQQPRGLPQRQIQKPIAKPQVTMPQPKPTEKPPQVTKPKRSPQKVTPTKMPLKPPIISQASRISRQERINATNFLLRNYQNVGRRLKEADPNFQKLVTINAGNAITWYGRGAQDHRLRKVAPELAFAMEQMSTAYHKNFKEPINMGYGWDYRGHSNTSAHYTGLGIDIDVGPNVGTKAYNTWAKQRFSWVANFIVKNYPRIRILFGDAVGQKQKVFSNHGGHMHFDLKP